MGWQLRRGSSTRWTAKCPAANGGGPSNERLLTDTAQARAHALGLSGPMSSWSAICCAEFAQNPSARSW